MKQIKQILASSVLLLATTLPAYSTVDESAKIQQVNFTVQVSRQVERDNMQVTLYAQESGKTLKEISASVTNKINMAVDEAKKRNIQTGMTTRRTNITYDKQGKPNGWIDYAEITLESKDFTALSELIAATSEQLAVQNISFTVSDETKQSLEKELTEQALLAFKQKAELISKNLSAKGYQIANLDIGNPNDFGGDKQPIYYERKAMFSSSDVPNMQVQSGMVDLKMVVNATINLTNN